MVSNPIRMKVTECSARVFAQAQAMEELGESSENIEIEMRKAEKALTSVGVTIRDVSDPSKLRDLEEIMDELAGKWNTLSDATKNFVAEGVAGTNRRNYFITMMENYDRVLELTNAGLDSNGELIEANEKRVQSLEGQINILTDKMLAFMDAFQPAIYNGVQFGIVLVDGLTKVTNFVSGNFIPIMAGATTGIIAFKAAMNGFTFAEQIQWMGTLIAETAGLTTATTTATMSVIALKSALGFGLVTTAVVGGVALLIKHFKSLEEQIDNTNNASETLKNALESNRNISTNISDFERLNKLLEDQTLEAEKRLGYEKELETIKNNLIQSSPTFKSLLEDETTEYEKQVAYMQNILDMKSRNDVKDALGELEQSDKRNAQKEDEFDNYISDIKRIQQSITEDEAEIRRYQEEIANTTNEKLIKKYEGYILSYKQNIDDMKNTIDDIVSGLLDMQSYADAHNGVLKQAEELNVAHDIAYINLNEKSKKFLENLILTNEQQDKNKESMDEVVNQAVVVAEAFRSINESASEFDSSDIENATQSYVELAQKARNIQSVIDEINKNGIHLDALDSASEYMASFTGNIGNAEEVLKHLNEVLQATNEETYLIYANLLSYDKSYWESANANSTEYFNNNIKNTNEWANFQQQIYNQLMKIDAIMNESKVANYDGYFSHVAKNMQTELANCKSLAEAKVKIETLATEAIMKQHREVANAMKSYGGYYDMKGNWVETSEYHEFDNYNGISTAQANQAISSILKWKENALASIQSIDALINTAPTFTSSIGNMSDSLSSASKEAEKLVADLEDIADAYYEINNALKDVENALDLNKAKQENSTGRKRVELMREEVELLKKKQQLLSQQQTEMEKERDTLRKTLQNNGFSFSDDGSITNYQKRLKELQNWANSLSGDNKENAIESVEGLVDVIERYTELIKDEIPDVIQSWEEMTTAIKEAEREQLDYVTEVQKNITTAIKNELQKRTDAIKNELQKQQDLYNSQYDEEDWNRELSEGQRKIDEIKAQINALSRDTSLAGQLKLEQLKNDLIEQETLINDMIREHEKELGNNRFDEEISNLEDTLEEQLTPENLASLVNQALATGFVQIGDSVMELDTLMTDWLDDFGDGLYAIGDTLKSELIDQLVTAKELMSHVGIISLSNNAGVRSRTIDTNGINNGVNLSIGNLLNIDGNLTEDLLPEVELMLRNASQELLNKISSQLSFR